MLVGQAWVAAIAAAFAVAGTWEPEVVVCEVARMAGVLSVCGCRQRVEKVEKDCEDPVSLHFGFVLERCILSLCRHSGRRKLVPVVIAAKGQHPAAKGPCRSAVPAATGCAGGCVEQVHTGDKGCY